MQHPINALTAPQTERLERLALAVLHDLEQHEKDTYAATKQHESINLEHNELSPATRTLLPSSSSTATSSITASPETLQVMKKQDDELIDQRMPSKDEGGPNDDGELVQPMKTVTRADAHIQGIWHGVVHIWVVQDGTGKLLLQERCVREDENPHRSLLSVSCAGHVATGETFEQAAERELGEELGLHQHQHQLHFIAQIPRISVFCEGKFIHKEHIRVYSLITSQVDAQSFQIDRTEAEHVHFIDVDAYVDAQRRRDESFVIFLDNERYFREAFAPVIALCNQVRTIT